tara:strand:- start:8 stop:217 length:210 start_codon:yes stop_codon:yes gene_type:complete
MEVISQLVRILMWPCHYVAASLEKDRFTRDIEEYKRIENIDISVDLETFRNYYNRGSFTKKKDSLRKIK